MVLLCRDSGLVDRREYLIHTIVRARCNVSIIPSPHRAGPSYILGILGFMLRQHTQFSGYAAVELIGGVISNKSLCPCPSMPFPRSGNLTHACKG